MENMLVQISDLLQQGRHMVAARIITLVGSAPRTVGAGCIIRDDGSLLGTIGGGFLEYQVIECARQMLSEGRSTIFNFRLTGKDVAQSEMLCGGLADVYLEPLSPRNPDTVAVYRQAAALISSDHRGTLLTRIAEGLSAEDQSCRALVVDGKILAGSIDGLPADLAALTRKRKPRQIDLAPHGTVFAEPVEAEAVLYLFGAGHVSTFVAPLAKMVGFRVVVIDDRAEFANRERFPNVDEFVVRSFEGVFDHIQVNPSSYLTVITRGHMSDHTVLRDALGTRPAYIGMIGSRTKRDLIYKALLKEGFSQTALDAVHSPIGTPIAAETPEEIAVSIVGELIQCRAALQN